MMMPLIAFVAGPRDPGPAGAAHGPWWEYFGYGLLSNWIVGVVLLTMLLLRT
jgi:hypothetical protein